MTSGFDRKIVGVDVQAHIRRAHALRSRYILASVRVLIRAVRRRLHALWRHLDLRSERRSDALRTGYPRWDGGQP
jgi:hypothetical protein